MLVRLWWAFRAWGSCGHAQDSDQLNQQGSSVGGIKAAGNPS
jgi:hypothetical protein